MGLCEYVYISNIPVYSCIFPSISFGPVLVIGTDCSAAQHTLDSCCTAQTHKINHICWIFCCFFFLIFSSAVFSLPLIFFAPNLSLSLCFFCCLLTSQFVASFVFSLSFSFLFFLCWRLKLNFKRQL